MSVCWSDEQPRELRYTGRHRREFSFHDRRRDMDTHHYGGLDFGHVRYVGKHRAATS